MGCKIGAIIHLVRDLCLVCAATIVFIRNVSNQMANDVGVYGYFLFSFRNDCQLYAHLGGGRVQLRIAPTESAVEVNIR